MWKADRWCDPPIMPKSICFKNSSAGFFLIPIHAFMPVYKTLIRWYEANKRDLPWRNSRDPYVIWLSEIILQQTRVDQGLPYFNRFLETFPTVRDLAAAPEEKVLRLWQGLGYYSRARNMHAAANALVVGHNGRFPAAYAELLKLKGVGEYTAAAIASFAFNLPHAVVDGNVFRFLSRFYGLHTPINTPAGKKEFNALAGELLDKKNPGLFNQAIMEFGSLHCRVRNPLCEQCPFRQECYAYNKGMIQSLPVKIKSAGPRSRHFNYLFINYKNRFLIRKRMDRDIWQHLFEFPLIETRKKSGFKALLKSPEMAGWLEGSVLPEFSVYKTKHQLSHQTIHAVFYHIRLKQVPVIASTGGYSSISHRDTGRYAFPRLIEKYLARVREG